MPAQCVCLQCGFLFAGLGLQEDALSTGILGALRRFFLGPPRIRSGDRMLDLMPVRNWRCPRCGSCDFDDARMHPELWGAAAQERIGQVATAASGDCLWNTDDLRQGVDDGEPAQRMTRKFDGSYDCFISYKSDDAGVVRAVSEQLMAIGLNVWFAEYSISLAGRMQFRQAILEGIHESAYGLCFTSPAYFKSEFCEMELQTLVKTKRCEQLIEIRLDQIPDGFRNPMPEQARTIPFTDCSGTVPKILECLGVNRSFPPQAVHSQQKRREWMFEGKAFSLDVGGWHLGPTGGTADCDCSSEGISFVRRHGAQTLRGTLRVHRESETDPCLRDGTMDDLIYFERAFGAQRSDLEPARCKGLHLLRMHGFRQLAFTTHQGKDVARSYTVAYPQPQGEGSIVFTFSFLASESLRFFLRHAYELDSLVTSLACDDFLCPYDSIDPQSIFVLPPDAVRMIAEQQSGEIDEDANTLTTNWMKHTVGRRMAAPGRPLLDFDLKIDMLVKTYAPELVALVLLKLPVGVQRPAIEAFTAMSERWDRGSHNRAAEAMVCMLSIMDQSEARHLLYCTSDTTRALIKSAAARLKRDRSQASLGDETRNQDEETAPQQSAGGPTRFASPVDPEMVEIPSGPFLMGSTQAQVRNVCRECGNWSADFFAREQPQREVTLDRYWIDRFPVTNAQYKAFIDDTGHLVPNQPTPFAKPYNWDPQTRDYPPRLADHPVVLVEWGDACAYAAWAGKRLPTEAEWEKAARGSDGRIWPWGNQWNAQMCNHGMGTSKGTSPVSAHADGASPFGVVDMAGNVWEWCADGFDLGYHRNAGLRNPRGEGPNKVIRGGSWFDEYPELFRCAVRDGISADAWEFYRGFRCVRSG